MTAKKPLRKLLAALMGAALSACFFTTTSDADIVALIEGEPTAGRVTLEQGKDAITLTDEAGEAKSIALEDIDSMQFGDKLMAVRSGDVLLIRNDRKQTMNKETGSIKLRAGLHRFVVPYWQADGPSGLSMTIDGPGFDVPTEPGGTYLRCYRDSEEVAPESEGIDPEGFRLPELPLDAAKDRRLLLPRARYRSYSGDKSMPFTDVGVFNRMEPKNNGTTSAINANIYTESTEYFGLVFEGFFVAKQDGNYSFALASDDGSQLYFGRANRFEVDQLGGEPADTPWLAELRHGGRLMGEAPTITDSTLSLGLPLGKEEPTEVSIGLPHLAALWDSRLDRATIDRSDEPQGQDTAYIRDKEETGKVLSVSGRAISLDGESLIFDFRGKQRTIAIDRVAGVVFAHADRLAPPQPGFHQTLNLLTGQVLAGRVMSIGETVQFELIGGGLVELPRAVIGQLRNENGRRVDLTRIEPTAEESIPYFGLKLPSRINTNYAGTPIRLFDQNTYPRGIAVHSKSRLHYKLQRPAQSFRAKFGLLAPSGKLGNVTARVIGDGQVLWEQADITADTPPIDVDVKLAGVERMILEVDFGKGQNVGDRAAWCEPQLIYDSAP